MEYISSKDYLEVIGACVISNVDFDVISRLYQPLIGYKSAMLYFTLVNYMNNNEGDLYNHEYFFKIMQITPSEFLYARKNLEACGLIKTYLKDDVDIKKYTYIVHSPKSPRDFFNDILFKGLLVKYIGDKEAIKLSLQYKCNIDVKDLKDVSANFVDVFQPDFNDSSFDAKMPYSLKDTKALKVDTKFSFEDLFTHLKTAMMINESAFSSKECTEIERIATLYGLDVITTADIIAQSYDERKRKGSRVDIDGFKERAMSQAAFSSIARKVKEKKIYIKISGHTELADEIKLMQELSPKAYLENKQDGAPPVTSDLYLMNYLSEVMGLNNETINAIISYSLSMCDNRLIKNYVEKVAGSIKREKLNTALDTLNYLEKKVETKKVISKKADKTEIKKENIETKYNEDEYNKLIDSIMKGED